MLARDRRKPLDRFDFYDKFFFDYDIAAECGWKIDVVDDDIDGNLLPDMKPLAAKSLSQNIFINRFK